MITTFKKVAPVANEVELNQNGLDFKGTIEKKDMHTVLLRGDFAADLEITCNRCGAAFEQRLHTQLDLVLTDQVQRCEDLDTIECLDSTIDLHRILDSEAQNLLCGYHRCKQCDTDEEFEVTL